MNFHADALCGLTDAHRHKVKLQAQTHRKQAMWSNENIVTNVICTHKHIHTHTQKRQMLSLGTLLMALRGRRTRTVRMADRLIFCRSREYSTILEKPTERVGKREKQRKKTSLNLSTVTQVCYCFRIWQKKD